MKKVLISAMGESPPFKGGIAQYVASLADALDEEFNVEVVGSYGPDDDMIRPRLTSIPYIRKILGSIHVLWNIARLRPTHVIIAHPFDLQSHWLFLLLRRFIAPGITVQYVVYGTEIIDHAGDAFFEKLMKRTDGIIAISKFTQSLLDETFPKTKNHTVNIVYPTVSKEFLHLKTKKGNILNNYNLKPQEYILSIGRLYKRKGHHTIINDFKKLLKKNPDMKYVIVGSGPEKDNLRQLAHEKSVSANVVLTDHVTEVEKKVLIENCLLYVHPSKKVDEEHQHVEGFGIAILEALSMGKAVVVTEHGGMNEIVDGSPNVMRRVIQLLENSDERSKLEDKADELYKNFSPEGFEKQILEVLQTSPEKIIYVVEWFYPVIGGAGKQALSLAKELKDDFDIVFVSKMVQDAHQKDDVQGFPVYRFGKGTGKMHDYSSAWELFRFLQKQRADIDVLHIHGNIENNFSSAAVLFGKIYGKKVIGKLAIHGEMERHLESEQYSQIVRVVKMLNPLNWIRQALAKTLDQYIAISTDIRKELRSIGIPQNRISYIPNGVNMKRFKPASDKELGIPRSNNAKKSGKLNRFVVISRLARHKGIIYPLLHVWKSYFADQDDMKLVIVGSGGGLSSSIEDEVQDYINSNNVKLVGEQDNVVPYLQKSDYFILPSENEGLSNALLEAAASGLICIAARVSGNTDVISDGTTGFLFNAGDGDSLHKAMMQALQLSDKDKRDMSKRMREHIEKNFSIASTADQVSQLYS